MKKKSNSKKTKLKINSLENTLFKRLKNEELKQIKGGTDLTGPGEISFGNAFRLW